MWQLAVNLSLPDVVFNCKCCPENICDFFHCGWHNNDTLGSISMFLLYSNIAGQILSGLSNIWMSGSFNVARNELKESQLSVANVTWSDLRSTENWNYFGFQLRRRASAGSHTAPIVCDFWSIRVTVLISDTARKVIIACRANFSLPFVATKACNIPDDRKTE